jgi:hypothetical protein
MQCLATDHAGTFEDGWRLGTPFAPILMSHGGQAEAHPTGECFFRPVGKLLGPLREEEPPMDELKAETLAEALRGRVYRSDENVLYVVIDRNDRRLVVISEVTVDEYEDWEAFQAGQCYASIRLA